MARRPLSEAGDSRLALQLAEPKPQNAPPLVRQPKRRGPGTPMPKSFRLRPAHLQRFQDLSARLSEEAGRPISEADVLKGLLLIGERMDAKKLLAAIKDAVFEGG
jgi:hypothetical protein